MGYRSQGDESDWQDAYHDDPIDEKIERKVSRNLLASVAVILGSVLFFQTTFAGNISLNSGGGVEFGQGATQTVACSGGSALTVTPTASFVNASGVSGSHYLKSVTVTGIPDSCRGADFIINAYGASDGTPLALFNTSFTNAVVYNNAGTFQGGIGSTGLTVTSSSGSFTVSFTIPVAASTSVNRITIQSSSHTAVPCSQGGTCVVGDTGPGGGTVFYVAATAFTETDAPCASTCRYLEAAPNTWYGGSSDPGLPWSGDTTNFSGIVSQAIGSGFSNTNALIALNSTAGTAITAARAYRGPNNLSDWFLPSYNEMDQLALYANARGNVGFQDWYWVSSDQSGWPAYAWVRMVKNGGGYLGGWKLKTITYAVRPVRAF